MRAALVCYTVVVCLEVSCTYMLVSTINPVARLPLSHSPQYAYQEYFLSSKACLPLPFTDATVCSMYVFRCDKATCLAAV